MSNPVRRHAVRLARGAVNGTVAWRYDQYHRADAMRAVESMVQHNGRTFPASMRKQCDDYARGVLGSSAYAPWLYAYSVTQGQFREGLMPDNYYGRWVVPVQEKLLMGAAATKSLARRILRTDALPDVAYVIDGRLHDLDMRPVPVATVSAWLEADGDDAIFKGDGSSQGRDVHRITPDELRTLDLGPLGDGVLQRWVRQHPYFAAVIEDSVGTVRITTVKEPDGSFTRRAAMMKVGRRGHDSVGRGRSFWHVVVDDEGTLAPRGVTSDWREWDAHPDTGVALGGTRVPRFAEAVRACLDLHASVPQVGLVGWDVTIDEDERVRLLEWNVGHAGISHSESVLGPLFTGLGWETLHLRGRRPA